MTHPANSSALVAKRQLLRGIAGAAAIASVLLTVAVLPAEYGIDPTGIGKALGLTALHGAGADVATTAALPSTAPPGAASTISAPGEVRALTIATKQSTAYRTDTLEVTLPPGKGLEVKTHLAKGATLSFAWKTAGGEPVNHDFHGEPVNAKDNEFESFIKESGVSQSGGTLIAPFTGVHGWYWKNRTMSPVTVVLQASGFYTDIFKK